MFAGFTLEIGFSGVDWRDGMKNCDVKVIADLGEVID